jgi:hypothetical protein
MSSSTEERFYCVFCKREHEDVACVRALPLGRYPPFAWMPGWPKESLTTDEVAK